MAMIIQTRNPRVANGSTYRDLSKSFAPKTILEEFEDGEIKGNDIETSTDLDAIRNSLNNILTTVEGERKLYPTFGLDFSKFLGSPLDETTATFIGQEIRRKISAFEPRVQVAQIAVIPIKDQNMFHVKILFSISKRGGNFVLDGRLLFSDGTMIVE